MSAEGRRLRSGLDLATEPYATTIVTVEEIMRGWMAAIHRIREPRRQVSAYELQQLFVSSPLGTFWNGMTELLTNMIC